MQDGNTERRRVSTVAAVILAVAIGAGMLYVGVRLATIGVEVISKDSVLLGLAALLVGVVLIGIPVAVLASQLRSVMRRRG